MDLSENGGQPAPQQAPEPQAQAPAPQQQAPQQQAPQENNEVLLDNPAFQAQEEQEQQNQPPAPEPTQYDDPYKQQSVGTIRQSFEKYLDEKFPLKGKLDINKIDREDPQALSQFFSDIQENTANDLRNEQLRRQAEADFQSQVFEPVYDVFPKLRQDETTDSMVRTFYRGAAADNPNVSPVKVAAAFRNFVKGVYDQGLRSGRSSVQNIPTPPVGNQGRAAEKILNTNVVEKMAGGGVDDVANLVASLQNKGVGGL